MPHPANSRKPPANVPRARGQANRRTALRVLPSPWASRRPSPSPTSAAAPLDSALLAKSALFPTPPRPPRGIRQHSGFLDGGMATSAARRAARTTSRRHLLSHSKPPAPTTVLRYQLYRPRGAARTESWGRGRRRCPRPRREARGCSASPRGAGRAGAVGRLTVLCSGGSTTTAQVRSAAAALCGEAREQGGPPLGRWAVGRAHSGPRLPVPERRREKRCPWPWHHHREPREPRAGHKAGT